MPGESYLDVLDGLYDSPIRLITCRHESRRGEHGGGLRQAHRPPRRLHRHARARGDPCVGRRPHGLPGLDAPDPPRRAGRLATRRSARRSRRSTTGGCSGRWRSGSRRSTAPTASPSTSRGPTRPRARAGPGPVVLALPEDMLAREATPPTRCRSRPRSRIPARPTSRRCAALLEAAERPLAIIGGAGWTPQATRRPAAVPRGERDPRRAPPSAARTRSTTTRRATSATSGSASTRLSPRA